VAEAVLLAGASGLTGGLALERLLARPLAQRGLVLAPVRRKLEHADPALRLIAFEPTDQARDPELTGALRAALGHSDLGCFLCCLGSTIAKAGSRAAFEAIDRELVLRLARIARRLGARQAIVVSSVGADPGASNFYLAVKGRMEQEIGALGFERVDLLRPGLLLGERTESRPIEALSQRVLPWFNPLLRGALTRYRAIDAAMVANASVSLIGAEGAGVAIHEYDALMALGERRDDREQER
jgi:uncharacterized protein YbjT (DUF2867 family)